MTDRGSSTTFYLPGATIVHEMHPSAKFVALLLFFAWAALARGVAQGIAMFTLSVAAIAVARAWPALTRMRGFLLVIGTACCVIWLVFQPTMGGTDETMLGRLPVSVEAFCSAAGKALRLVAMLIAGLVVVATTRLEDVSYGLRALRVPWSISFAVGLSLRLLPTFLRSVHTVVQAQRSRGYNPMSGNLFQRITGVVPLIVPVLLGTLRTTDMLAMALECRAFSPKSQRTSYIVHTWGWMETATVAALLLIDAIAAFARFAV